MSNCFNIITKYASEVLFPEITIVFGNSTPFFIKPNH